MGVGIIFLFISTAATSAGPYFFGKVIDYAIPKTNWSVLHNILCNVISVIDTVITAVLLT